jgi:4'-phosphopantetheinyl transferase
MFVGPENGLGFVDIWQSRLTLPTHFETAFNAALSTEEQRRSQSLRTGEHQQRYRNSRGLTRYILASYLHCAPHDIEIRQDTYGKPYLPDAAIRFNLSHSDDLWLLAVSDLSCVGADIELVRPRRNLSGLAQHSLSAEELALWKRSDSQTQLRDFFRLWSIKEAFAKATGRGLAIGLANCVVDMRDFRHFLRLPPPYQDGDWHIVYHDVNEVASMAVVAPQAAQCRMRATTAEDCIGVSN